MSASPACGAARADRAPILPFTVVIATRDRGATVTRTVDSILGTSYPALEIVVVDQSRDDGSERAMSPLLDRAGGRVRYLRTATTGVSHGRNLGIASAGSEWIAITDDDCEVPEDWLDALAAAIAEQPEAGIICGNVLPGPHDPHAGFIPGHVRTEPLLATSIRQKHHVEGISACMALRRSVWRDLGGFDVLLGVGAPLRSGAESDLVARARCSPACRSTRRRASRSSTTASGRGRKAATWSDATGSAPAPCTRACCAVATCRCSSCSRVSRRGRSAAARASRRASARAPTQPSARAPSRTASSPERCCGRAKRST